MASLDLICTVQPSLKGGQGGLTGNIVDNDDSSLMAGGMIWFHTGEENGGVVIRSIDIHAKVQR